MALPLYLQKIHASEMAAHAQACLPEEACGMVAGKNEHALRVFPVTNEYHSPVRFRMEPSEQIKVLMWMDDQSCDLLAIFHSHPAGPAVPSQTDIVEFNYPGALTVILTPQSGNWQMRAFSIQDHLVEEVPICWIEEETKT